MVASQVKLHEQLCGIFIDHDPCFLLGIVETVRLQHPRNIMLYALHRAPASRCDGRPMAMMIDYAVLPGIRAGCTRVSLGELAAPAQAPTLDMQQLAERVMLMDSQSFGASAPIIGTTPADTMGALFPTEFYATSVSSGHAPINTPSTRNEAPHYSLIVRQNAANGCGHGHTPIVPNKIAPIQLLPPLMPTKSHTPPAYWPQWQSGIPQHPHLSTSLQTVSNARKATDLPAVPVQRSGEKDAAAGRLSSDQEHVPHNAANEAPAEHDVASCADEDEALEFLLAELTGGPCVSSSNGSNSSSSSGDSPQSPRKPSSPAEDSLSRPPSSSAGGPSPSSTETLDALSASTEVQDVIDTTSSYSSHDEDMAHPSKGPEARVCGSAAGVVCTISFEPSAAHAEERNAVQNADNGPKHLVDVACSTCKGCIPGIACCESHSLGLTCVSPFSKSSHFVRCPSAHSEMGVSGVLPNSSRSQSDGHPSEITLTPSPPQSLVALTATAHSRAGSAASSVYSFANTTTASGNHGRKNQLSRNGSKGNGSSFNSRSSEGGGTTSSRRHKKGGSGKKPRRSSFSDKSSSSSGGGGAYQGNGNHSSGASSVQSWADPAFIPNRYVRLLFLPVFLTEFLK